MKKALQFDQIDLSFIQSIWQEMFQYIPKILASMFVFLLGLLTIRIVTFLISKALKFTKIDVWTDKLNEIEIFKKTNFDLKPATFIIKTVKWILILIFTIIIADILGLKMISKEIGNIIQYLPKLFSAIAFLTLGIYFSNTLRNVVISLLKSIDFGGSKIIGNIIFYCLAIIIALTALKQGGINTDIITNNLTVILGSFLLAFTIAFGLGSKEIIQRILFGFYSRKNLTVGQKIRIGEFEGTIESIDNIYLVLINDNGKFIFPIKEIIDRIIQILDDKQL